MVHHAKSSLPPSFLILPAQIQGVLGKFWASFVTLCFAVFPSLISMFSYLAVVRYNVLQILIEQSNSGSLANGANYHPPKTPPRSDVWASTACASSIQPCMLQKMGQRCVISTYLSSIPGVVRCVHQRKMAQFKCLWVCVSNPGTQRGGLFPGGVQAGLCVLASAVYSVVGAWAVFAPWDTAGCCVPRRCNYQE